VAAVEIDWAERAGMVERAVVRRHLRRLGGLLPGTRIGRIRWPRRAPMWPFPWHYWWQAHLLDCIERVSQRSAACGPIIGE
jgi:predicted alpha-1,6-mannanase (GH76 family)